MEPLPLKVNSRTAMLVVDMQNYFFKDPQRAALLGPALPRINQLISAFDLAGLPVVHVLSAYHEDRSDWDLRMQQEGQPSLLRGSQEAALLAGLCASPRHHRVV